MWPCNGLVLPGWGLVAPQNHEVSRDGTMMHTSFRFFSHHHLLLQSSHTPTPGLSTAFFVMIAWRPRFCMFLPSARECAGRPPKGDNVATLRLWERRTAIGDAAQVSKTFARRSGWAGAQSWWATWVVAGLQRGLRQHRGTVGYQIPCYKWAHPIMYEWLGSNMF